MRGIPLNPSDPYAWAPPHEGDYFDESYGEIPPRVETDEENGRKKRRKKDKKKS